MEMRIKAFWSKYGIGYLFMLPFLALFLVFVVIPVAVTIGLSFTNFNLLQVPKWIGLTNYKLLFMDDDVFLIGLKNTFVFALVTGPIGYLASLLAAWAINQLAFRKAFSLAFYTPSITSYVAMTIVWLYFFSPDRYGLVNNMLINLGLIENPILWNMDQKYIMSVIILISVWMSMGTGFLVFLAGLQNIPRQYYEAASIDGVKNKWQELFMITLPMLKPQLLFGAVTSIVNSFGVFDIAVQFAGMPSPNYAGHTIVTHLYDYAFIRFEMGYASAVSVVLFLLTFILGQVVMKLLSSKDI